jgi:hypothetical protein
MIERKSANFILNEAGFVVGCGQSNEKFNEVQDEICYLKPIDRILNKLFKVSVVLTF